MAIAERVTDYWGITEAHLSAAPTLNYVRAKARSIADTIGDLYREHLPTEPVPTEEAIDALGISVVERYVAALSTLKLIGVARDFYMQDRLSKSQSASFGGGLSATYVKKVDELDKLEQQLMHEAQRLLPAVVDILVPVPVASQSPNVPSVVFPSNRVVNPVYEYNRRTGKVV